MAHPLVQRLFDAFRRISSRTRTILLLSFAVSIFVFFLATLHLFNFLLLEDRVQSRSIGYMRHFVGGDNFDKKLKIILIREKQNAGAAPWGDIDKKHREFFGNVVKAMTQGGAKVLAFDIAFEDGSDFDKDFGNAIAAAEKKKLKVIVGIDGYSNGKTDPEIPADLQQPRWGTILVGGYQGDDAPIGTLKLADLDPTGSSTGGPAVIPSLALRVVMEAQDPPLVADFDQSQRNLVLYSGGQSSKPKSIPLERQRNLLVDQVSRGELDRATVDAQTLFNEFKNQTALDKYKDAIVLIGYEIGDSHEVLSGGNRLGVELHATAISNMLNNIFIYKLPPIYNYLVILFMSLLGALLYTPIGKWADFKVPIPIPWTDLKIPVPLGLIILAVIYLIFAFMVYKLTKVYLDVCYHLAALVFSYAALWFVLNKWFPDEEPEWGLE